MGATVTAHAGDTWDGGGANDNWTTGQNWNGIPGFEFPPPNNGTANLLFPSFGGLVQTPIVNVPYSINSLTFNNGDGRYVILGASELTIGGGGIVNNDADIQSIIGAVKLAANHAWTANAARLQVDSANLNGFNLTIAGSHEVDVLSIIVGGGGVTIADAYGSTSTMLGGVSNTYTGLTDVQGGTLALQKSSGVAIPGDLTIGDGATVLLAGNEQISEAPGNVVTINPGGLLDVGTHTETLATLNVSGSVIVPNGGMLTASQIQVEGASVDWTGNLFVDGLFDLTGGGDLTDYAGYIANAAGSIGTATVSGTGSHWSSTVAIVGTQGDGSLTVDDGGSGSGYTLTAAFQSGSTGSIDIVGSGANWTAAIGVTIGWLGSGEMTITDGGVVNTALSVAGYEPGSAGNVTISGEGSAWFSTSHLSIGWEGEGAIEVLSGGSLASDEGRVGAQASAVGEVIIDGPGSSWIMKDVLVAGGHGNGTVHVTGGASMQSLWATIGDWPEATGEIVIDGPGSSWTNLGDLFIGYAGTGSLAVTNDATVRATNIIIGAQAGVHGDGTIDASVENGGLLSPGSSAGTLSITGNYVQSVEGELLAEIGGLSNLDQLLVAGTATLGGTLTVNLADRCTPGPGHSFTILSAETLKGTFEQVVAPRLLQVSYTPTSVVLEVIDSACPADLFPFPSGDAVVGPGDLAVLLASWGPCGAACQSDLAPADCLGDGIVGPADLAALLAAWGACP